MGTMKNESTSIRTSLFIKTHTNLAKSAKANSKLTVFIAAHTWATYPEY